MKKSVRLLTHIKPEKYQITLFPDMENFTFFGQESILLNIDKPSKQVTLHSRELKIESAEWIHVDQSSWAGKICYNKKEETATLTFPKKIPVGIGQLKLSFEGILNDKLRGFYRSKYTVDGKDKYLATTQFESTDARQAFPCFDEPSQKAIFEVTLVVPNNLTAISNTIESKVWEHSVGFKAVQFVPTPKMSTYLLAFIIGDFEFLEGRTINGVKVRVFTTPGKSHQGKFALDVAIKCLEFYEKYFDIKYPLPVLDLIAIPDFAAGAMENWGAVTYRETALLIDEIHSAAANRQRVAMVIAHELAHMWFGDLVTMEWWTHLWLNEGFASYMEYLAVDNLFPEWQMWTQFISSDLGEALRLDALENTHPVEVEVHHPDEISEIFDAISYSKGASIIRMLAEFLGNKNFRDGLRHYLKRHKYSNAKTTDLWRAFEEISGESVVKLMKNWTGKGGHPVIRIQAAGNRLQLRQDRFFSSALSKKTSKDKTLWTIPVSLRGAMGDVVILMNKKTMKVDKPKGEWFKLNMGESGFFRTCYQPEQLQLLKLALQGDALRAPDRLGLVRDVFALSEAGEMVTDEALRLVSGYLNEQDLTVWTQVSQGLAEIETMIEDESFSEDFKKYARGIFKSIVDKVGWKKKKDEGHTQTLLRSLALYNFGKYGDSDTIKQAKTLFNEVVLKGMVLDPDLRAVVYNLVALNGGIKEYNIFIKKYKEEPLQQEKDRIGRALTLFKSESLLNKTLQFALSKFVRNQDAIFIMTGVFVSPRGGNLTWKFIKSNWKMLQDRFGGTHFALSRLIQGASGFHSEKQAKEMEQFFKKNPTPSANRAIAQTIEQIRSNAAWLKRDGTKIKKFLQKD